MWPVHVAYDDRRADTACAVGLNPAMLGLQETGHLLGEILDHVGALKLTMHQDIETDVLLLLQHFVDFVVDVLLVFLG